MSNRRRRPQPKPYLLEVKARPGEEVGSLLRRFSRLVKKKGIPQELRESKKFRTYRKPSEEKRLKRKNAQLRRDKDARKKARSRRR